MSTESHPPVKDSDPVAPAPTRMVHVEEPRPSHGFSSVLRPWQLARRLDWRISALVLLALVSLPIWRSIGSHARTNVATPPAELRQSVAVARVIREDLYNQVTIPAEFRPYVQVELHAKVSGYVDQMNVDIGDKVKAGQVIATLDVPELKDEMDNAIATQAKAEANYTNAHLIYTRLVAVNRDQPNGVALQELDAAEAKDRDTAAAIAGAKAEVEKYQTLIGYTRITAPFAGVVTRRYVDPGALIQSGTTSATQSLPLVRVSDNYHLRLDFPVSVGYVKDIHVGDTVDVKVESLGGKTFSGTISRYSHNVDEDTRTMMTEIDVANPNLEMMPGMYASLIIKVQKRSQALTVPTESISIGKTPTVYLIDANEAIEERPVTLGLETPGKYEIISGLKEGDLVMIGSRSQVKAGQKVQAKLLGSLAQQ